MSNKTTLITSNTMNNLDIQLMSNLQKDWRVLLKEFCPLTDTEGLHYANEINMVHPDTSGLSTPLNLSTLQVLAVVDFYVKFGNRYSKFITVTDGTTVIELCYTAYTDKVVYVNYPLEAPIRNEKYSIEDFLKLYVDSIWGILPPPIKSAGGISLPFECLPTYEHRAVVLCNGTDDCIKIGKDSTKWYLWADTGFLVHYLQRYDFELHGATDITLSLGGIQSTHSFYYDNADHVLSDIGCDDIEIFWDPISEFIERYKNAKWVIYPPEGYVDELKSSGKLVPTVIPQVFTYELPEGENYIELHTFTNVK